MLVHSKFYISIVLQLSAFEDREGYFWIKVEAWPETVTFPSLITSKWEDTAQEEDEQAGEIQW